MPLRFHLVSSNGWTGVRLQIVGDTFNILLSDEEQYALMKVVDTLKYNKHSRPEKEVK